MADLIWSYNITSGVLRVTGKRKRMPHVEAEMNSYKGMI